MDEKRPRDLALMQLLRDDARAAELYAMLPDQAQSILEQNAQRINSAEDMERLMGDYMDGI